MPSTYAHLVFGQQVLEHYPAGMQKLAQDDIDLFHIGLHGPDILFYYHPLRRNSINAIGYAMHDRPASEFFGPAAQIVRSSPEELRPAQRAYLLGFLTHLVLDSTCHSYIEKKLQVDHVPHAEIEMEFDRKLLTDEFLDPLRYSMTAHIHPSPASSQIVAQFFPTVNAQQVERALKGMIFYNQLLQAPTRLLRVGIDTALRFSGNYEGLRGMVMSEDPNPRCEDSSLRLTKLMHKAVGEAISLTQAYLPCLEQDCPLPPELNKTFGPAPGWEEIPILSPEEEEKFEV